MRRPNTSTGLRAYMEVVVSRSALTTIVMWSHRMMLATMQAELIASQNTLRHNGARSSIKALARQRT
jgi:hypothetical protein